MIVLVFSSLILSFDDRYLEGPGVSCILRPMCPLIHQ